MNNSDIDPSYEVGYGRPPQHTRFKPGESGNPKGRPKKKPSFRDEIEKELNGTIRIQEANGVRRITKRQAISKQFVAKAIKGDVRSADFVVKMTNGEGSKEQDSLDELVQEFRVKNAQHRAEAKDKTTGSDPEQG